MDVLVCIQLQIVQVGVHQVFIVAYNLVAESKSIFVSGYLRVLFCQ